MPSKDMFRTNNYRLSFIVLAALALVVLGTISYEIYRWHHGDLDEYSIQVPKVTHIKKLSSPSQSSY